MTRMQWRTLSRIFGIAALLALPAAPALGYTLDDALEGNDFASANVTHDASVAEVPTLPNENTESSPGDLAARVAEAFIGTPYALGEKSGKAIDCSGLMQLSYDAAGVPLPRTAAEQSEAGSTTSIAEAAPGDLMFYRFHRRSEQLHVAMYVGRGRAVHASIKHGVVRVVNILTGPWPAHLVKIVRPDRQMPASRSR